ncbi:MAG: dephospho-CoA kinase [Prevotellaceae bacterium]|jgi:dephospho-CoA kinase|nr:dephospho-CoA kinase [Prevotellaceae bacterium]
MLKIGLTGGIGSGKTLVSLIFKNIGIPVFCADIEAKNTYFENEVRRQMINIFGKNIYIDETRIDKTLIASKIFNNKDLLEKVNSIIHPAVCKRFDNWLAKQKSAYIIHEAAILFESGFDKFMDKTVVVNAPQDLRIMRVMSRDNQSYQQIIKRMENQMNDDERNARADFIINNYMDIPILPQILKIHEAIKKLT